MTKELQFDIHIEKKSYVVKLPGCFFNPLRPNPVYIRDFRKILPFLLKSRFLLLSLHLYTKWVCRFDSPLNFEETGAISSKRHQKVSKFYFFSLNFWWFSKNARHSKGNMRRINNILSLCFVCVYETVRLNKHYSFLLTCRSSSEAG